MSSVLASNQFYMTQQIQFLHVISWTGEKFHVNNYMMDGHHPCLQLVTVEVVNEAFVITRPGM